MSEKRIDAELHAEALTLLVAVDGWELVPERWETVSEILGELRDSLAAGDTDGFRRLLTELKLTGPARVDRIGHGDPVGRSESARELIDTTRKEIIESTAKSSIDEHG